MQIHCLARMPSSRCRVPSEEDSEDHENMPPNHGGIENSSEDFVKSSLNPLCPSTMVGGHMALRKLLTKCIVVSIGWGRGKILSSGVLVVCSRKAPIPAPCAPMQLDQVERPLQRIAMNILGPLPETEEGNKYILVLGDYFTKWKEAYPLPNMEAMTVARSYMSFWYT